MARRVSVEQSLLVPLAGLSAPVSPMIWDLRLRTRTYSGIPMRVSLLPLGMPLELSPLAGCGRYASGDVAEHRPVNRIAAVH